MENYFTFLDYQSSFEKTKIKENYMKKIFMIVLLFVFANSLVLFATDDLKKLYPHWDFSSFTTITKLKKIDSFIKANADAHNLAVFDWDGTLYNEHIPVADQKNEKFAGQPAWYIWAANHDSNVFPLFDSSDNEFINNVITKDRYLEGRTNIQNVDIYSKFTQTSIFTAGMTPKEVTDSIYKFLEIKTYSPEQNAFLPMLDVLQRMHDAGFDIWIITGSNPYFVSTEIKYVEDNIDYTSGAKYNFGKGFLTVPYDPATGHIAGNTLKLLKNCVFSIVYDDRYVKNDKGNLYIVDHEGKAIAMNNIAQKDGNIAIFAAGNSDGDFNDIQAVTDDNKHLAIAVAPAAGSELEKLVKSRPENTVELTEHEADPQHVPNHL